MSVDPLKSKPLPQADAGRVGASHGGRRTEPSPASETQVQGEQPAASTGDSVQLSAASRTLVERVDDAERVPGGTVSAERMREVLRRLESDHYNSAEVRDKVAQAVRQDLGLSKAE
jgi:hypothetical protein